MEDGNEAALGEKTDIYGCGRDHGSEHGIIDYLWGYYRGIPPIQ